MFISTRLALWWSILKGWTTKIGKRNKLTKGISAELDSRETCSLFSFAFGAVTLSGTHGRGHRGRYIYQTITIISLFYVRWDIFSIDVNGNQICHRFIHGTCLNNVRQNCLRQQHQLHRRRVMREEVWSKSVSILVKLAKRMTVWPWPNSFFHYYFITYSLPLLLCCNWLFIFWIESSWVFSVWQTPKATHAHIQVCNKCTYYTDF